MSSFRGDVAHSAEVPGGEAVRRHFFGVLFPKFHKETLLVFARDLRCASGSLSAGQARWMAVVVKRPVSEATAAEEARTKTDFPSIAFAVSRKFSSGRSNADTRRAQRKEVAPLPVSSLCRCVFVFATRRYCFDTPMQHPVFIHVPKISRKTYQDLLVATKTFEKHEQSFTHGL